MAARLEIRLWDIGDREADRGRRRKMKLFEAVLILLIVGSGSVAIAVRQQRNGTARFFGWGTVYRNTPMFLLCQAIWVFFALVCFCSVIWILARPYLQP